MKKKLAWILFLVVAIFNIATIAKAEEKPTILVLGDSLSAGYNIELEQGWVELLNQKLQREGYPHTVVNGSISGDTTTQGLLRLPTLLEQYQPEVVIIELGGNDALRGTSPTLIKRNLSNLISTSKRSGAEVLLLGIQIPPNYGQRYAQAFFDNYAQLANEKKVKLVPFFLENVGGNNELMQEDGIHPNAKAQPTLLKNVWPQLETQIKMPD
ncbi:arylesterase [Kangiella koreensis]|uniref:Arylesterase n=1 Tax=Kangiella koreensis (strain DSM 16069 / JCM 12317 / KCTC 12182 / SW-125) TaxID=523791 RepID=C7RA91_KANKD|nr:arylesterase [Kangiella koreensis]ACV26210.1 Arylesterase [Kangiella koreensis DSM 16069]